MSLPANLITLLTFILVASPPATAFANEEISVLNLRVELWQVPKMTGVEILDRARGKADTTDITLDLRKCAKSNDPDITLLALPGLTARSGQRAKVESGRNEYVSSYRIDEKTEQEVPVMSTYLTGTSLETDAVIGADGVSIDINLAFKHALEEPILKDRTVIGPISGKELQVQSVLENRAELTTSTTLLSGQTRLIGSLPVKKTDSLLLIFLYGEVVKVNP